MAVVDLAKGPAEAFGPLKAVLESISVFYTEYQVCFFWLCSRSPLTIASAEHRWRWGQDRDILLTHHYAGGAVREACKR